MKSEGLHKIRITLQETTCFIQEKHENKLSSNPNINFSVKKLMTPLDLEINLQKSLRIFQITENSNKITDPIEFSHINWIKIEG
jgi:hypothetical protein